MNLLSVMEMISCNLLLSFGQMVSCSSITRSLAFHFLFDSGCRFDIICFWFSSFFLDAIDVSSPLSNIFLSEIFWPKLLLLALSICCFLPSKYWCYLPCHFTYSAVSLRVHNIFNRCRWLQFCLCFPGSGTVPASMEDPDIHHRKNSIEKCIMSTDILLMFCTEMLVLFGGLEHPNLCEKVCYGPWVVFGALCTETYLPVMMHVI